MIEIKEKKNCCGCEACYNACPVQCISMKRDEEGFKYPCVDTMKCIGCNKCEKVCPCIHKPYINRQYIEGYAAINKNLKERLNSSSGGVFSLLATKIIELGGVVIGSTMTDDCKEAMHIIVDNTEELAYLYGSKYLQSNINNIYSEVHEKLKNVKWVLFSGTPCQVEGLLNYLGSPYEKLICVDLICHGVPSPGVWKKHVENIEKKKHLKLKNVNFRCKKYNGYSDYGIMYQKSFYKSKEEDTYFQLFMKELTLRLSCYDCKFKGIVRNSDITLGDFWGIDDFAADLNDGNGISIVVIQSEKGKKLFEEIKQSLALTTVEVDKVFATHNNAMTKSSLKPINRETFWNDFHKLSYEQLCKKYIHISSKEKVKSVLRKIGLLEKIQKIRGGVTSNNSFGMLYIFKDND